MQPLLGYTTPKKSKLKSHAVPTQNLDSTSEDVQVASSSVKSEYYYILFYFKYKFPIKLIQYINYLFILSGFHESKVIPSVTPATIQPEDQMEASTSRHSPHFDKADRMSVKSESYHEIKELKRKCTKSELLIRTLQHHGSAICKEPWILKTLASEIMQLQDKNCLVIPNKVLLCLIRTRTYIYPCSRIK
ncbi:uncharacterized protein LOC113561956 isoform X1 [Ooceraea biroi]|uniref:uncharacterized protein LOC113561956 isoform X1 n=1 Tax=Ooceraea biroi TaxID=2015173 RepID=UPI000F082A67|nr:uncharacterized protein LOC113561956 isoform X1 [Ooceraea biroi]